MKSQTKLKILAGMSLLGLLSTAGLAMKSGDRLSDIYETYTAELNYSEDPEEDIKAKYAKKAFKELLPVLLSMGLTATSILLLYRKALKTELILSAALGNLVTGVIAVKEDHPDILEDELRNLDLSEVRPTSKDEIIVYEPITENVIITTKKKIEKAEAKANKRLQNNYIVRLSSIIHDLGDDVPDYGYFIGWEAGNARQLSKWNKAQCLYISLRLSEPREVNGRKIYILQYDVPPEWIDS